MDPVLTSSTQPEPTISYPFVTALTEAIAEHEDVVETGMRRFGLHGHHGESGRVPLKRYTDLFEWLAEELQRPYLGLELTLQAGPEALGAVGYLFLGAQNLEIAVRNLGHYLLAVQESSEMYLGVDGEHAFVHYGILDNRITKRRHDTEYSLGYVWRLMQMCSATKVQLVMVEFEHDRPEAGDGPYRQIFGAPVLFRGRANRLHFRAELLHTPSRSSNPYLFPILEAHMQSLLSQPESFASFSDLVLSKFTAEFLSHGARAKSMADDLGISESTLHRRLRAENITFKRLSDQAAKSHASFLISQKTLSIGSIARRLGYAETACLTRAFRRWFDMSPREYRNSLSANTPHTSPGRTIR